MSQENNTPSQFKEVQLYDKLENNATQCRVCEFHCTVEAGGRGACRVRYNEGGMLVANNYGVISRGDIGLTDERHFYHLFPGAKVFSLGGYGQNFPAIDGQDQLDTVPDPPGRILSIERLMKFAIEQRCRGIIFTYNEPTMWYEYLRDACVSIKANGMFSAIVSNGYITTEALELVGHYIDGLLLQLNAFNDQTFMVLTGQSQFQKVLETTTRFQRRYKGHVEVSTKLVPNVNDSPSELNTIAAWVSRVLGENTAWHLSCASSDPAEAEEVMTRAKEIGHVNGLHYVYLHGLTKTESTSPLESSLNLTFDTTKGNNTYCFKCHHLVIERTSYESRVVGLEGNHCIHCGYDLGVRTTIWKL